MVDTDHFVALSECHFMNPQTMTEISYYPGFQRWFESMGWPHTEELIGLAGKHRNLHLSMSGIVGWYERAPYRGYHAIGTALQWIDPSKIVMGFDLTFDDMKRVVDWVRTLQIPDQLQQKYGYPEISEEMRAGFLGLNLARLAGIDPIKRLDDR